MIWTVLSSFSYLLVLPSMCWWWAGSISFSLWASTTTLVRVRWCEKWREVKRGNYCTEGVLWWLDVPYVIPSTFVPMIVPKFRFQRGKILWRYSAPFLSPPSCSQFVSPPFLRRWVFKIFSSVVLSFLIYLYSVCFPSVFASHGGSVLSSLHPFPVSPLFPTYCSFVGCFAPPSFTTSNLYSAEDTIGTFFC